MTDPVTADDLRKMIAWLASRVRLRDGHPDEVIFDEPTAEEMLAAGLHPDAVRQALSASWWREMAEDIVETPRFCAPEHSPADILRYARDVVGETFRKRFELPPREPPGS